jgi:hypothetical protein
MLMSGSIMHWFEPFSDSWRQGATFVHDWFAIGLLFAITGHILLAFRDPDALNGMVHGWVKPSWAKAERPRWYEEMKAEPTGGEAQPESTSRNEETKAELTSKNEVSAQGTRPDAAAGDARARADEHGGEAGLGAREVAVVDRMDGGAGDGVGEREL